jgi:5-methylcytosine-specific restriction endonuclease McrA
MTSLSQIRWQKTVEMGGIAHLHCESCGQHTSVLELHHIINKGRTVNNQEAREASECPELMILLCRKCHAQAHNPADAQRLLGLNGERYDRGAV